MDTVGALSNIVLYALAGGVAGPLLAGTALLGTLVVNETLSVTAGAPTWMWLAAGGSTLLLSGIVMERHEVGPVEGGRRLVDIVREGFA